MTTTGTTVKNTFFDGISAASAATGTQKENEKTQSFGDVLGKTAQKLAAPASSQTDQIATGSTKPKTQQSEKTAFKESKSTESAKDDRSVEDAADTDESVEEKRSVAKDISETETLQETVEEPADELTIDEIAHALEQIIEQIKEILGITDEELLSGMEDLGMQPLDLLNTDNMAQLVTAISGEDSTISLVANEELYTALQDITGMVDTQVNTLLENTGLTSETLDAILQKLQELESRNLEEQMQNAEILPEENQREATVPMEEMADEEQVSEGPVIIKEDNVQSDDKTAVRYDKLPENQQENPAETAAKTQNAEKDNKGSDDQESKHFGQGNTAQSLQNNLNEVSDMTAAEGVEKFTSESTENIMRQLADMVKIVRNENLTEMELQLHPASLGTVNVSLTTKGGIVTAEFTTQSETVKAAIEAQASQLRANLEEQGVKIEAIEVSVESHQMERDLDKNGDQQQKQAQEQETGRIQGLRRGRSSINLRAFADGEELEGEMQGADDATRIAMEIMAANGNTMDLLA